MGSHSIIPPSSAAIWGKSDGCTGWVNMSQMYPQSSEQDEAASEGDATHELAAKIIRRALSNLPAGKDPVIWVGVKATNGVIITADMLEAAEMYANDVIAEIDGDDSYGIEVPLKIPRVHDLSFGTPDAWRYDPAEHELVIWDAKFGYLVVQAFENWQAINYYAGLFDELGLTGVTDQTLKVRIRIVQPFAFDSAGPIKEWATTGADLRGYVNVLEANAAKALSAEAKLRTGDQCRYCQARHACPAALAAGLGLWEVAAAPLPVELPADSMGLQLKIINRAMVQLKGLQTGYEEQVKAQLKAGKFVPGWDTEPSFGNKKWKVPVAEVVAMGDMMGIDLRNDKAVTPIQAGNKGLSADVISAYSETPRTGLKLVEADDNKAKRVFSAT